MDLIRNQYIGFVFQNYHLIPGWDAKSNILLPALYAPLTGKQIPKELPGRADQLISMFHLENVQNRNIRTLSGGEQQRIAIARALLMDPPVILADEPTGNLDPHNTDLVLKLFRDLTDQGKTVIMVTHDPAVTSRADRVLNLSQFPLMTEVTNTQR